MTAVVWTPKRTLQETDAILTAPGALFEIQETTVKGNRFKTWKNAKPDVREFWLASAAFGDRPYLAYEDEHWTYKVAHARVNAIAHMLAEKYGCKKGDVVGIAARNSPEYVLIWWATQLLGCVLVAANAWVTPPVLEHCFVFPKCRLVFVDPERAIVLAPAQSRMEEAGVARFVVVRGRQEGMDELAEAVKSFGGRGVPSPSSPILPDDVSNIYFTSGTTGLPKGVIGTHRQYTQNVLSVTYAPFRAILRRGDSFPAPDPKRPQGALLIVIPLFHTSGQHGGLGTTTMFGNKAVLMHKWDAEQAAEVILKERVTAVSGMPFMSRELVDTKLSRVPNALENLSYGGTGSSPALAKQLVDAFGKGKGPDHGTGAISGHGYGATEITVLGSGVFGEDFLARPASCGLPPPIVELAVHDEDTGAKLETGKVGELYVRGVAVTNGYLMDKKATEAVFLPDAWFKTGDVGYLDHEGFLYLVDRAKDIIIRGGENIAAGVVEAPFFADPRILDVAAVPVPDEKLHELVAVVVVTKPEYHGKVTEAELLEAARKVLPRHCNPVMVDIRTTGLPRSPVGKTLKRELKVEVAKLWEARKAASSGGEWKKTFPENGKALLTVTRPSKKVWLLSMHNMPDNRLTPHFLGNAFMPALDYIEYEFWRTYYNGEKEAALVITGERENHKFFSNGIDIPLAAKFPHFWRDRFYATVRKLLVFPMHVIAANNGHTFPGGCIFSQACDWRIFKKDKAWIAMNELDFGAGLTPGLISALEYKIAPRTLRKMLLQAHRFTSSDALEEGLVDEVVDGDGEAVIARAVEFAETKARFSATGAVPHMKAMMARKLLEVLEADDGFGPMPVDLNKEHWEELQRKQKSKL